MTGAALPCQCDEYPCFSTDMVRLSTEILERLRAALITAGAPLRHLIEPGLTDQQIDDLEAELGVGVAPELRTIWKWARPSPDADREEAGRDTNPRSELWEPALAVKETHWFRSFKPELAPCIAFAGPPQTSGLVVPGERSATTSPVTFMSIDDPDPLDAAPSLGSLFQTWTGQLAGGEFQFVGDEWQLPDGRLPFP